MFVPDLLRGKRILITGGGTGLGKSMAGRILELGAEVVICGRRADVLEEAAAELKQAKGGTVRWRPLDIRDPDAVESVIGEIWTEAPIHGLINNAAAKPVVPMAATFADSCAMSWGGPVPAKPVT